MAEAQKKTLENFWRQLCGACSNQYIQLWWILIMRLEGLVHEQYQMPVIYRYQWSMTSVRHLRQRTLIESLLVKVSYIILLIFCAIFSLTMSFNLFFIIVYFVQIVRLWIILYCVQKSKSRVCTRQQLEADFISSRICRCYFPIYKKKGGRQKTPYILSTEDFMKW